MRDVVVVGSGIAAAGVGIVNWSTMLQIAASWVISPIFGAVVAALLLHVLKVRVLYAPDRLRAAATWVPLLIALMASAFAAYYLAYEYLHWCMHVPAKRWIEGTRFFKWIDIHHRVHHLHPMKNLNVVLPVADFLLRSRLAMPAEAATAGVR